MKTPLPKVSVLVPAYNEEKYIEQTLRALSLQDYPNYEVLVVDNASTDRTADVVSSFLASPTEKCTVKLLHESRQGTQFARECGRRAATGKIIAQLDADCLPPIDWISKGVELLQRKDCVSVAGPYDYFDSSLIVRGLTSFSQQVVFPVLNKLSQAIKKGGIIIGGNVFIKAAALNRVGGYNTSLTFYGDDADIAKKLSACGRIIFTRKLIVKSSSRRYNAAGFFAVQSKYTNAFFQTLFYKGLSGQQSIEMFHPR